MSNCINMCFNVNFFWSQPVLINNNSSHLTSAYEWLLLAHQCLSGPSSVHIFCPLMNEWVMVAEWIKTPAVWCDPWPGHVPGLWVRIPLESMAGLHTFVKPLIVLLINFIVIRINKNIHTFFFIWASVQTIYKQDF